MPLPLKMFDISQLCKINIQKYMCKMFKPKYSQETTEEFEMYGETWKVAELIESGDYNKRHKFLTLHQKFYDKVFEDCKEDYPRRLSSFSQRIGVDLSRPSKICDDNAICSSANAREAKKRIEGKISVDIINGKLKALIEVDFMASQTQRFCLLAFHLGHYYDNILFLIEYGNIAKREIGGDNKGFKKILARCLSKILKKIKKSLTFQI
jgi:hypothetical protein